MDVPTPINVHGCSQNQFVFKTVIVGQMLSSHTNLVSSPPNSTKLNIQNTQFVLENLEEFMLSHCLTLSCMGHFPLVNVDDFWYLYLIIAQ